MRKKSPKGTVSIDAPEGRIRLRFSFNEKRYSKSLYADSKVNMLKAKSIAIQIERDIAMGVFDTTLNKYLETKKIETTKSFVEMFEHWVSEYKQMDCEKHINYNQVRNMISKWKNVTEHNIVSHYNRETFSDRTFNRRLTMLKGFSKWMFKQKHWTSDPMDDVSRRILPKNKKKDPKRKPFTPKEISQILEAFKTNSCSPKKSGYTHSYYYPFIYFIFKAGVRNAEAIGLRVKHVNFKTKRIRIEEVMARSFNSSSSKNRKRKSTKNEKERDIPLTTDLKDILTPQVTGKKPDDLVFTSPNGLCIDDNNFRKRIFYVVLDKLKIERRVLYACRHTFGSRCIHEGMTPVMTAFLMGNNPKTVLGTYTHQIDLPKKLPKI